MRSRQRRRHSQLRIARLEVSNASRRHSIQDAPNHGVLGGCSQRGVQRARARRLCRSAEDQLQSLAVVGDGVERAYRLEQDPEIAAHLVDVRWQLGERDSALELLRQALAANPDSRHLQEVDERLAP